MQQGPLTLESPLTNQGFPLWVDLWGGIFRKMHENYKHFWAKQGGTWDKPIFWVVGGSFPLGETLRISHPPPPHFALCSLCKTNRP